MAAAADGRRTCAILSGARVNSLRAWNDDRMRFSLGVTYWPRRSAVRMWRRFDAGEIREDFAHIAHLGLDTVRFFVRWDDFAPAPEAIDPVMLSRLTTVLDAAADAGLHALPVLFCGHVADVNFLPSWALDRSVPRGRYRTFCIDRESGFGLRDLYTGAVRDAQIAFARGLGERVAAHPAIVAWDIGNAFASVVAPSQARVFAGEHATAPVAEPDVAEWSRGIAAALRAGGAPAVTAGADADDLMFDRSIRFGSLCAPFAFASIQGSNLTSTFARDRRDPDAIPFLATLAAAFSYRPVLVSAFGNPACPPERFSAFERFARTNEPPNPTIAPDDGVFATYPCLTDDENAAYAAAVLERLHADGRLGAYWSAWSDYGPELGDQPPFDEAPHAMTCGLIRADGSEKPVAQAFATFAREQRDVAAPFEMPMISSTYYYRTLPSSTKTLYTAYVRARAPRAS
jgi:hypothetical protein